MMTKRRQRTGPRYSIVPGDFVDDERAQLSHYRVLLHLGRWTDKSGWFRRLRTQREHAVELGMGRQCFNRALNALIAWGYVEKKVEHERRYYRVLMDRGEPDDEVSPADDTGQPGSLSRTYDIDKSPVDDIPPDHVSSAGDTGVAYAATPYSDLSSRPEIFPPTPRLRGRTRGERERELISSILDSLDALHPRVVRHLLRPVLQQRHLRKCPDPQEALRLLAEWADRCKTQILKNAAKGLIHRRTDFVRLHDLQDAVAEAAAQIGAPICDSVPGAAWDPGGVHITETAKPRQFEAWLAWHQEERAAGRTNKAGLMEAHRFLIAPSEWPPTNVEDAA